MKILFLGPKENPLISWLENQGETVTALEEKIDNAWLEKEGFHFLISYGYRHILKQATLDHFPNRAINLHISYLPWNRGADPNLWSFIDDTPKGVTLHYIDAGIDTGDIIAQTKIDFSSEETLSSSYKKLKLLIESLFKEHWPDISQGKCPRHKQSSQGSIHRSQDKSPYLSFLEKGWDTSVEKIKNLRLRPS